MTTEGCDVAVFQKTVDYDQLDTGFVIAKATEGTGFTDAQFARNWRECSRVGITRGAYHFARPDLGNKANDEADWFLGVLGKQGGLGVGDLLALDYEVSWGGDVVDWCMEWLERVRTVVGFRPLLYLNLALVRAHDWSPVIAADYPLWLADYDQDPLVLPVTPWPVVAMKQWTSIGTLRGIAGRVDRNTFFGDAAALAKYGKLKEDAVDLPIRIGQSADPIIQIGEVTTLQAVFHYPDGRQKTIARKVWGHTPRRYAVEIRPPVDPDSDPTEHLDAEPAVFAVTVTP